MKCEVRKKIRAEKIRNNNYTKKVLAQIIQTKRSERAKQAHSVLREVEKMGYKKIFPRTRIG